MAIAMRAYVSPIGYDSSRVTRPVISHGIDPDDHIILLRPTLEMDDNRASQAVRDVEQMVSQIEPDVEIRVTEVPHDDFQAAVDRVCDVLDGIEDEVVVNLSGGAREIFLALCTAAIAYRPRIDTFLSYSDIDGEVRPLDIPDLTVDRPDASFETLERIEDLDRAVSISELTDLRGIAKSTVTRHLQQLEDSDLVRTWQDGKAKYTETTFSGRLMVRSRGE